MTNPWITHVKEYAKTHNIPYRKAMKEARPSYKPKRKIKGGEVMTTEPDEGKMLDAEVEVSEPMKEDAVEPEVVPEPETAITKKPKKRASIKIPKITSKVRILPFREAGKFPPSSRKLLEAVGNERITSLRVDRAPISPTRFLKRISYYREALKKLDFDDTYHLLLVINDKYELQKNEVLNFSKFSPRANTESRVVKLPEGFDLSINELIENTRKAMGMKKFSSYNVLNNNCQVFVANILKANGLRTPDLDSFVNQDLETLFQYLPKATTKVIRAITKTAARINRLVEGEGMNDFELPPEPKGLLLKFSSTEMSQLDSVYLSVGKERRKDGEYEVVQTSLYYPENIATGGIGKLGWQQFPRDKDLGYHLHDVEFVSIYYKDNVPVKVYMSCHVARPSPKHEGNWYDYKDCQFSDGYLVVYVARNSHANYNRPGLYKRMRNLANDVAGGDGKTLRLPFNQMDPSVDKCFDDSGICLYKGLRTAPPDYTLTKEERLNLTGRTAAAYGAGQKPRNRKKTETGKTRKI
jgi:hypothetical protein